MAGTAYSGSGYDFAVARLTTNGALDGTFGVGSKQTVPTLNLATAAEVIPDSGVYITRTCLEGEQFSRRSVTNIGMRPTFNGSALSIETHLLDVTPPSNQAQEFVRAQHAAPFSTPKRIEVRFWQRLRDEKKFTGPEELRAQIARDIAAAHRFFSRLRRFRSLRNASLSASRS